MYIYMYIVYVYIYIYCILYIYIYSVYIYRNMYVTTERRRANASFCGQKTSTNTGVYHQQERVIIKDSLWKIYGKSMDNWIFVEHLWKIIKKKPAPWNNLSYYLNGEGTTISAKSYEVRLEMTNDKLREWHALPISMDWFCWENLNRKPWFLPSNWSGFPVKIFPSSNSMPIRMEHGPQNTWYYCAGLKRKITFLTQRVPGTYVLVLPMSTFAYI